MSEHDAHDHELVMPFIVVASQEGPYDDTAYVAGWQAATIDATLARFAAEPVLDGPLLETWTATVYTANMPQIDLIAMRRGFNVQTDDALGLDEWTAVAFTRVASTT